MNIEKKENVPKGLTMADLKIGHTYITDRGAMYLVDNQGTLINLESGIRVLATGGQVIFYHVTATVTWEYAK